MKYMSKLLMSSMIVAVSLALAGCGSKQDTPATPTAVPTVEPTVTVAPTAEPKVTEAPEPKAIEVQEPTATLAPTETPTPTPVPHVHEWVGKEIAVTCTTDGKTWEECECGETQNEIIIPATGHEVYTYTVIIEPSVENDGMYENICNACGEVVHSGILEKLTPTPTPEPTATPTPKPTNTPTPTPKPTATPTPSPTPVIPEYTYLELDIEGYAWTNNQYVPTHELTVHNLPSMYGKVIDTIMVGEPIRVTGQCNETGWFRIVYGNQTGYFSSSQFSYLQEEPKQVPAWTKNYTFTDMYEKMFAIKDASIYTEPSKNGSKAQVRYVKGNEVWVTGQCNETGWYRVTFGGTVAYVDDDCISVYAPKSKYEKCPYPLDSWEDKDKSITAYYVNGVNSDTMTQALNLLTNRYPFYTRIDFGMREHAGYYSEGDVYKATVTVVLEEFPEQICPLYMTNALQEWARCFYVEGDDPAKIERAKQDVRWTMEYNIREYGLTGELVEKDYFVGEYTEGRVFCYDLRIKK